MAEESLITFPTDVSYFNLTEILPGIRLMPIRPFKRTTFEEVRGCLQYKGPRKLFKDMEAAIAKGSKESR